MRSARLPSLPRRASPEGFRELPREVSHAREGMAEERSGMSSEQNKNIVRRVLEEPWRGNLDVVEEFTSRDYIGHDPANPKPLQGPQGVKEFVSTYRAAFPDAQITVEQQLAEGDLVATRWTGRGTHEGELLGIPPTGKQVTVSGLTISRVADGKIVEEFQNWDNYGLMQQLGAVPAGALA
jgi:steroid delta-isomerase-like uncharacterized protein